MSDEKDENFLGIPLAIRAGRRIIHVSVEEHQTKGSAMELGTIRYETPVGTFGTWEEAAEACERCDLDPCECIKIVK